MKNHIVSAIALIAFTAPGLAAVAAPAANSTPILSIRYNDLDLQNARDAGTMLQRIRRTAVEICQPGETGFEATARFETCYQKTVDQSVAKLNAPRVIEALNTVDGGRKLARLP
ncbi:MAG: UrcA family protein [Phenylobacterium sp.]